MSSSKKEVIIIGSGISGMAMAIQLKRILGHNDFEIYDKGSGIGGTWRNNKYPGCACDIPAHLYSFSFCTKPDWSSKYPARDELYEYFRGVARKFDLYRHCHFNSLCISAEWDEVRELWVVEFENDITKERFKRECSVLVTAVGTLDNPSVPEIKGRESFKGESFHSARWDYSCSLKGKNVMVLGNGASGTQFMSAVADEVGEKGSLTQIVRGAHWWMKRGNPEYGRFFKFAMKYLPGATVIYRTYLALQLEQMFKSFWMNEDGKKRRDAYAKATYEFIKEEAPREYWDILRPDYEPGCKRRVNTFSYLKMLHRPNVDLKKDEVVEMKENSVVLKNGKELPADVIIYATGFKTQEWLSPMNIRGVSGKELHKEWKRVGGAEAYKGTVINGFPNFFILYGPNAATGQHSVLYHSECQVNFVCRLLRPVLKTGALKIEVTAKAQKRDLEWVHSRVKQLVFSSGCQSWWMNAKTKKNTFIYPDPMYMYWLRTLFVNWSDFRVTRYDGSIESNWYGKLLFGVIFLAIANKYFWESTFVISLCLDWKDVVVDLAQKIKK